MIGLYALMIGLAIRSVPTAFAIDVANCASDQLCTAQAANPSTTFNLTYVCGSTSPAASTNGMASGAVAGCLEHEFCTTPFWDSESTYPLTYICDQAKTLGTAGDGEMTSAEPQDMSLTELLPFFETTVFVHATVTETVSIKPNRATSTVSLLSTTAPPVVTRTIEVPRTTIIQITTTAPRVMLCHSGLFSLVPCSLTSSSTRPGTVVERLDGGSGTENTVNSATLLAALFMDFILGLLWA